MGSSPPSNRAACAWGMWPFFGDCTTQYGVVVGLLSDSDM